MSLLNNKKKYLLGIHYFLTIFLNLILVPYFTGLDPAITLIIMGIGTLFFHFMTKRIVPFFLGPSMAFIGGIAAVIMPAEGNPEAILISLAFVKGGLIVAAVIFLLLSVVVHFAGIKWLFRVFPTVVVAPLMIAIGFRLSGYVINGMIFQSLDGDAVYSDAYLTVSVLTITTMVLLTIFAKKRIKPMSLFIAFIVGYVASMLLGLVDTTSIATAPWTFFGSTQTIKHIAVLPMLSFRAIMMIAPIALVAFMQHFGELKLHEMDTQRSYFKSPGLNRTLLANSIVTFASAAFGAPAPIMHLDHQSIMTDNKVYNARIVRLGAGIAIALGCFGKLDAILKALPVPLMSSVAVIIFGTYAVDGLRLIVQEKIDFTQHRNILITVLIVSVGIGIDVFPISGSAINVSGLFVAAIIGIILNIILPEGHESQKAA